MNQASKKNIAIVAGGFSPEYTISINSAAEIEKSLDRSKFNVYKIIISADGWAAHINDQVLPLDKSNFTVQLEDQTLTFDCALIAIHGTPGEDGILQSYFDLLKIPYTSCNAGISSLTFNKFACKAYLEKVGITTPQSVLIRKEDPHTGHGLSYPFIVKPNNSGSSVGISKVNDANSLESALDSAFAEDGEILLEEFIEGPELTCGLVKLGNKLEVLPLTEIISKNEFFDYEAKYTAGMAEEITPAKIPEAVAEQCRSLSAKIYNSLGCSGIVRIDYILSKDTLYFLEINTVPGMSAESVIPRQIRATGQTLGSILEKVIIQAMK